MLNDCPSCEALKAKNKTCHRHPARPTDLGPPSPPIQIPASAYPAVLTQAPWPATWLPCPIPGVFGKGTVIDVGGLGMTRALERWRLIPDLLVRDAESRALYGKTSDPDDLRRGEVEYLLDLPAGSCKAVTHTWIVLNNAVVLSSLAANATPAAKAGQSQIAQASAVRLAVVDAVYPAHAGHAKVELPITTLSFRFSCACGVPLDITVGQVMRFQAGQPLLPPCGVCGAPTSSAVGVCGACVGKPVPTGVPAAPVVVSVGCWLVHDTRGRHQVVKIMPSGNEYQVEEDGTRYPGYLYETDLEGFGGDWRVEP